MKKSIFKCIGLKDTIIDLLRNVKRPLMWGSLLVALSYVLYVNVVVSNTDFDNYKLSTNTTDSKQIYEAAGTIQGQVYKIENRNDKLIVYLKRIKVIYQNETLEKWMKIRESNHLFRGTGVVCYVDNVSETDGVYDDNYEAKGKEEDTTLKQSLKIGETITVYGKVRMYDKATNPGQFDMRKYYLSKGILFRIDKCEIRDRNGKSNLVLSALEGFGKFCESKLDEALDDTDAGLMKAVMFADKNDIDSELKNMYTAVGAGHLLAISGLHISLVGMGLLMVLKRAPIPLTVSYGFVITILFLYGLMIGFSPSSNRAIIMFIIMSVGKLTKKSYDGLTALAVSLLITTIIHPLSSLQAGLYLTYLAIVGLAVVAPVFKPFRKKMNKFINGFLASVSVTLTTLPVVINSYYTIPLYGVFLNVILVPGMSGVLVLGVLTIIWQIVFPFGVNVCGFALHLLLGIYTTLIGAVLKIPYSVLVMGHRNWGRCYIYLGVLLVIGLLSNMFGRKLWIRRKALTNIQRRNPNKNNDRILKKEKRKQKMLLGLVYVTIVINVAALMINIRDNRIEFLDVGQGLCSVVQYNGHIFMFDGGSSSKTNIYKYIIQPYLKYYGINSIDGVFVSHADNDHISGIVDLVADSDQISGIVDLVADNKFKIKGIYCPEVLMESVTDKGVLPNTVRMIPLKAGDRLVYKGLEFDVLSPAVGEVYFENQEKLNENANSLVLFMNTKECSALFMADAENDAEKKVVDFLEDNSYKCINIYQVAHHGSAVRTNSYDFIQAIKPDIAVISCGYNNSYNHPHEETVYNLNSTNSRIYRTDYMGCVRILIR